MCPGKLLPSLHSVSSLLPLAFAVELGFTISQREKKKILRQKGIHAVSSLIICLSGSLKQLTSFQKEILFDKLCYRVMGSLGPQIILNDL